MEDLLQDILKNLENKMMLSHNVMLEEFKTIRTGIANPQILDRIQIYYYNEKTLLKDISIISVVKPNKICIKPFDISLVPEIMKVLLSSRLGITPQTDGKTVDLIFPQPTLELRQKLTREIEKIAEQTKVSIRNLRRDGNNKIKKMKLDKSSEKIFLDKIQNLNNKWIQNIEKEKN